MMKRACEDSSCSEAKKSAGSGGMLKGMPGNSDDKVDPIPRNLKLQEITLHFTQRTWEEIGPGQLKYLPLCYTPYYMFDEAMKAQLAKFKDLWATAYYHTPKARLSNIIMLQDDLINQGGTPLETTAFTQACYMLKYTPTKQAQYFKLANIDDCNTGKYTDLHYDLSTTQCGRDYKQLISLGNYKDFEQLAIMTARPNINAGFIPRDVIHWGAPTVADHITNTYIPPNPQAGAFMDISCNLQPYNIYGNHDPNYIDSLKQVTWARNLDKITLHKYGDVVDFDITTNLEGVPLLNHRYNDLMTRETVVEDTVNKNKFTYYTEFLWPGVNRPYYTRKDNLSSITPYETTKHFKPLSHTFLTMPPIRKANGALLKQRASFLLEQSFSVTFHTTESIWGDGGEKILNQHDGCVIRPAIYGNTLAPKVDESAFCAHGIASCKGDTCPYDNSMMSMIGLMINNYQQEDKVWTWRNKITSNTYKYTITPPGMLNNEIFFKDDFKALWKQWRTAAEKDSSFTEAFQINCGLRAHIGLIDRNGEKIEDEAENVNDFIVNFSPSIFENFVREHGIVCKQANLAHTDYNPQDRDAVIFYV